MLCSYLQLLQLGPIGRQGPSTARHCFKVLLLIWSCQQQTTNLFKPELDITTNTIKGNQKNTRDLLKILALHTNIYGSILYIFSDLIQWSTASERNPPPIVSRYEKIFWQLTGRKRGHHYLVSGKNTIMFLITGFNAGVYWAEKTDHFELPEKRQMLID